MKYSLMVQSLLIVAALLSASCSNGQEKDELSPTECEELIKQHPAYPLIDVRTPEEYDKNHLAHAQNFNWNDEEFKQQIKTVDTSKPVIVYCLSGGRSASAASYMRSVGFRKVYELKGGISQWENAGLPVSREKSNTAIGMSLTSYQNLLKSDKLVLVNFYATWCTPCKQMEPELLALEKKLSDRLVLLRIDADANQDLFKTLNIGAIPTLLLYRNTQLIWSHEGAISKEELEKQFR